MSRFRVPGLAILLLGAMLLAGCATVNGAPLTSPSAPGDWPAPTQATNADVAFQAMTASGESVHMAHGDGRLYYRRSLDEGQTWSSWSDLGSGTLYLEDPIAVDGEIVGVVTVDAAETVVDFFGRRYVGDLNVRLSRDRGATWEEARRITLGAKALRVSLSISGAAIHVAWMDYRTGRWEIRYTRSTDGGATWMPETIVAQGANSVGAERPSLEAHGDSVHLAWMDARDGAAGCRIEHGAMLPHCTAIYYARSADGGATWDAPRRLSSNQNYAGRPELLVNGAHVLIAYDRHGENSTNEIWLLRSEDGGAVWNDSLLASSPDDLTHGRLAVGAQGVHAVWMQLGSDGARLFSSVSADGAAWSAPTEVPDSLGAGAPNLAASAGQVHLTWSGPNLRYARRAREKLNRRLYSLHRQGDLPASYAPMGSQAQ